MTDPITKAESGVPSSVFIGDDSLLTRCAELARLRGHVVRCVVTSAPVVIRWAQAAGIPVVDPSGDIASNLSAALQTHGGRVDWIFSVANLRPLPPSVLALAERGGVNFHDGPLPKFGGVHSPAWAIMAGEREHGITWHLMRERLDTGDVLIQRTFSIDPDDTSLTLNIKCFEAGLESFPELLDGLAASTITPRSHVLDRGTYHRTSDRVARGGVLDWTQSANALSGIVRALDFGGYRNTLGTAKLVAPNDVFIVRSAKVGNRAAASPGVITKLDADAIAVATADGELRLDGFSTLDGTALDATEVARRGGLRVGDPLPSLASDLAERASSLDRASVSSESYWVGRLREADPLELPLAVAAAAPGAVRTTGARDWRWLDSATSPNMSSSEAGVNGVAAVTLWLAHASGRASFDVALVDERNRDAAGLEHLVADAVPFRVALEAVAADAFVRNIDAALQETQRRGRPMRDLVARTPELRGDRAAPSVALMLVDSTGDVRAPAGYPLVIAVDKNGAYRVGFDARVVDSSALDSLGRQLAALAKSASAGSLVDRLSMLDTGARAALDAQTAGTVVPLDTNATIVSLFAAQVAKTPDAVAVIANDRRLTYRELDEVSDRVAAHLRRAGVVVDAPVGLFVRRSSDLLIGVLGVLKAGGAYVPLDPSYPADRLRYMISDSGASVVLASTTLASSVPRGAPRVVTLDEATAPLAPAGDASSTARPESLAYVIYTSGSTGAPKGVMVEHRNVASFFAAMDRVLGTAPSTWLAVTSLSFDISVLELLWPLTHGSTVVVHGDRGRGVAAPPRVAFSLFYFSANEQASGAEKYRILLEGARFADKRGFAAVWTPERHFHAFGGLFPNPSVTGAAVAAITERVGIRAGSVVLPLHHPLRIAEEWSVVDNLSNGRVGISFASGWRPDDFVLRPEGYKDAKKKMIEGIEMVRRLWRGESMAFDGPDAKPTVVAVHPRPVQSELPVWITAAGSPDTFDAAGAAGTNVLTHLLGQTFEELKEKIARYRAARRAAGHAGPGTVSLMLHTFVGEDDADVKALVRGPMKEYLRTSVSLIEKNASAFPTFKKRADGGEPKLDFASLTAEEADALLEYSFERYYETSGLFGTVERCVDFTERLAAIGVDDVACLIDFGVEPETVLRNLEYLDQVRARFEAPASASIPELLRDHAVTHLQCTPSQAAMLLVDPPARDYLPALQAMLVGGEAMPPSLAGSLRTLGVRRLINMYGPTETTIWSTCHEVDAVDGSVPIGKSIANTEVRVVGMGGRVVPAGVPGELLIGGPGVTRGYFHRDELTAERFVSDEAELGAGRFYRTGDQVRLNARGELVFLGRGDGQVKVRGYRIELGEIERSLGAQAAVSEAAVIVVGDTAEDRRLVGYVTLSAALPDASAALRDALRTSLPEFMVPSQIVVLHELPRTPNGKIDRRRLPTMADAGAARSSSRHVDATTSSNVVTTGAPVGSSSELERTISAIWCDVLQVPSVGLGENFFDLGGHSLLAVQVHQRIKAAIGRDLPITDLFRHPTVRALAAHLAGGAREREVAVERGTDRAAMRRQAAQRRQQPADR